jgi:hypothetical protein
MFPVEHRDVGRYRPHIVCCERPIIRVMISRKFLQALFAFALLSGAVSVAEAQRPRAPQPQREQSQRDERSRERSRDDNSQIPRQYMPPPGMCRIWLKDVPPSQQPAPTDCPTAIRKRPANGRVIFGERKSTGDSSTLELRRNLRGNSPPVRVRIPPL